MSCSSLVTKLTIPATTDPPAKPTTGLLRDGQQLQSYKYFLINPTPSLQKFRKRAVTFIYRCEAYPTTMTEL